MGGLVVKLNSLIVVLLAATGLFAASPVAATGEEVAVVVEDASDGSTLQNWFPWLCTSSLRPYFSSCYTNDATRTNGTTI
jgi:hypothetical protein